MVCYKQYTVNVMVFALCQFIPKSFSHLVGSFNMAYNVQGFMQGWNFITSSPEPLPNKINKDEVNNKKYNNERQAETKAQQR